MHFSRLTIPLLASLAVLAGCDRVRSNTLLSDWRPTDRQVAKVDAALARFQSDPKFKAVRLLAPGEAHDRTYYGNSQYGERRIYVALSAKPPLLQTPKTQHRPATRPLAPDLCAVVVAVYRVSIDEVIEEKCLDKRFSR